MGSSFSIGITNDSDSQRTHIKGKTEIGAAQ